MRILIHHDAHVDAGMTYGGTERVVMWLARELVKRGHNVGLNIRSGNPQAGGAKIFYGESSFKELAKNYEVFHSFSMFDEPKIAETFQTYLVTIQGNGQPEEKFSKQSVFVSQNHAQRHGAKTFVYNGLDLNEIEFNPRPRPKDRMLFLSKTSWGVKNLKGAISICNRHQKTLWVAGGERPLTSRAQVLLKKLIGQDWRWVGSVNQSQKSKFLGMGSALLFPILWDEPFGIVMTEAMAAGTPVFAHARGSVPEVLSQFPDHLIHNENDWERVFQLTPKNPQTYRDWVRERFSQEVMTDCYLKLYQKRLDGESLNS